MEVPNELLEYRDRHADHLSRKREEIAALRNQEDLMAAELDGLDKAIEFIKAQPAPMVMPPPVPLYPGTPGGPEAVPTSASCPVSGWTGMGGRAPRRNITDLVRQALGAASPGEWLRIADLVKSLDVQKSQLEKALAKLTVDWDQDMDQVRWPVEESPSAEDKIAVGELPNGKVSEDIVEFLRRNPVGIPDVAMIEEYGYSREQLDVAELAGKIWCDVRGYWHTKIEPRPAAEAAE